MVTPRFEIVYLVYIVFKKVLKVNVQTESEPSQSESQGFFSQPNSSQNTQRPTSSQSRPRSRTNSTSRKSQLQKYNESKPLSCLDANRSRIISARRHIIENVN